MAKVLENWDVASLYPNEVRIFGYSSRNQKDKKAYIDLLDMRIKAKHGQLSEEFLKPMGLTNDDLKSGLKLPLNAYTGTLRAPFNPLYDNLQGFSICSTGQMLLLQLAYSLKEVPTVEITELNTDAVQYMVDEEYIEDAHKVLHDWEKLTGLELEQDNIVKLIQRDVNNYVEILQIGENNYDIHYKGGEFRGEHKFKWDKEQHCFHYSFSDDLENNSLTIVSEALLKYLLFETPIEETINKCNDIFRFQKITHLGGTYEKCVQESIIGDVELQRNNRIYAGKKPSGNIIKVKYDGRRDSLADQPDNPIVDNDNRCTIDDIDKKWYIKYTQQKVEDFLGTGKQILKGRKKNMKKDELIAENERLQKELEELKEKSKNSEGENEVNENREYPQLLKKINNFRQKVREYNFVLDKTMDDKHGGGEYSSIYQLYQCVQELCLECGLDFSFDSVEEIRFEKAVMTPSVGSPRHLCEVLCYATFTDIDTGCSKVYSMLGAGNDTIDKAMSGAQSIAFRKWFTMNFTPKQKFPWDDEEVPEVSESTQPKVTTYIPPVVKEEIKQKVVETEQHTASDDEVAEQVAAVIMEIRTLTGDNTYAQPQIEALQQGTLQSAEIDAIRVAVENKLFDLKEGK